MSDTPTTSYYGGPSTLTLLGLLFLGLKLGGVITWPWWVVLLPFYLIAGIVLFLLVTAAIAGLAWLMISGWVKKPKRR